VVKIARDSSFLGITKSPPPAPSGGE